MTTPSESARVARDALGEVRLPKDALYGTQTQRAMDNFPISGRPLPPEFIQAMGLVKWAAASANRDLGVFNSGPGHLKPGRVDAMIEAAWEIAQGKLADQFPVDVYQTGSGTSTNMNVNEVISRRAMQLAGDDPDASPKSIHPNDDVNRGQSTNDTFPTAGHVAIALAIRGQLAPAVAAARAALADKAAQCADVLKIGRTHLSDATPLSLGQELGGMARQFELALGRLERAVEALAELPIGGTAVGTGINTHPQFGAEVAKRLATQTGLPLTEAADHFEANATRDGLVEAHGQLRTVAGSLMHVADNLRWLASGPRCGIGEIHLPELQPGSSIMPGKVNPVLCEMAMQVAARVIGNDQTVAVAGATGGHFQLNIMMPLMVDTVLESVRLLASAFSVLGARYLRAIEPLRDACEAAVERSLALATPLAPLVGYERAAAVAKDALAHGKTVREVCQEQNVLSPDQLDHALNPWRMTRPTDSA